jgi:hypothetical protein
MILCISKCILKFLKFKFKYLCICIWGGLNHLTGQFGVSQVTKCNIQELSQVFWDNLLNTWILNQSNWDRSHTSLTGFWTFKAFFGLVPLNLSISQ